MSTASASTSEEISTNPIEMKLRRAQTLVENITHVLQSIEQAASKRQVRLVAISKLKPASDILALYEARNTTGHDSHFGENYFQELVEKTETLPKDINWHFTGTLQSNKCKALASIPNLWAIESLDTIKKADALEKGRAALRNKDSAIDKLRVFIQVNTSNEDSKSGCNPTEVLPLARHVVGSCPSLELKGLMTIGAIARSKEPDVPNEDFILLRETRDKVVEEMGWEKDKLELSMGMSEDYVAAIGEGATNVRVGTTIFGERQRKQDAKVKEETAEQKQ